jgi:hypothetical protein
MNYRGIGYSLSDKRNSNWAWKLHPVKVADVLSQTVSGEVSGTLGDAIAAAQSAIDKELSRR